MEKRILTTIAVMIITILGITSCSTTKEPNTTATVTGSKAQSGVYNTAIWQGNATEIWNNLQHTSIAKLQSIQTHVDPEQKAWIQLAIISKRNSVNTSILAKELLAWRAENPSHVANALLPDNAALTQLQNSPPPKQIALLLPARGSYAASGQTVRAGFLNAYYANLAKTSKQNIKFYDTTKSKNIPALYQQAVTEGADFIIGPLLKDNVQQLHNSGAFQSATLALNYTAVRFGSLPTNLYEFGLLPEDEAAQLADRAHQAGGSRALIIAPANAWGKRLTTAFSSRWQTLGGHIQDTWYFTASADFNQGVAHLLNVATASPDQSLNKNQLQQQHRNDFDVIFLFGKPENARTIVPLLRYYNTGSVPIYSTSSIYSGKPNPAKDVDLNGVIVCDIPWNMQLAKSTNTDEVQSDRLFAVGQDAYLLSQTLQRLKNLPNFPIYGTTGALTLSSNHQIHRRLPCVTIRNGTI